jgi:hypothetical protein
MPAWTFLTPEQRYDAIHYIRETFVKPHNPSAYFGVTPEYLATLPKGTGRGVKTAEMLEFEKGPKYLRMDFGPALFWTLQVEPDNIAYKGIAIRLDEGPGGVSKGRVWMLYDHDTLRVATAWTGDQFVDWRGIAFDGSHGSHTSIEGQKAFVNPIGPLARFDPRPTAVFAANDAMAVGCLAALRQAEVEVPAGVAVVGFDDIPIARYVKPALTTVRAPIAEVGSRAMARLLEVVRDDRPPGGLHEVVTPTLVIRESTRRQP